MQAANHSACRGIRSKSLNRQLAFCRLVSDRVCYTWIADVIVHRDFRVEGIGKFLLESVMADPEFNGRPSIFGPGGYAGVLWEDGISAGGADAGCR